MTYIYTHLILSSLLMDFSPEKRQIPSVLEQIWNYGIENILINMEKKKTERHIKKHCSRRYKILWKTTISFSLFPPLFGSLRLFMLWPLNFIFFIFDPLTLLWFAIGHDDLFSMHEYRGLEELRKCFVTRVNLNFTKQKTIYLI